MLNETSFIQIVKSNESNSALLELLPELKLPQCYLTAGCLFQTIWNIKSNHAPDWGIKDYDVFYWDDKDVSWEAENDIIERSTELLKDLGIAVEIRNQARVHLWYESRFGRAIKPISSTKKGIDSFLIACTSVGINVLDEKLYVPNGFDDIDNGVLRMNSLNLNSTLFHKKANDYLARWPWLTVDASMK